eukprot:scaffold1469_cov257-Pinguiococcus_pyrenoidosus.AAC.2
MGSSYLGRLDIAKLGGPAGFPLGVHVHHHHGGLHGVCKERPEEARETASVVRSTSRAETVCG